jgi:hypothetical protein
MKKPPATGRAVLKLDGRLHPCTHHGYDLIGLVIGIPVADHQRGHRIGPADLGKALEYRHETEQRPPGRKFIGHEDPVLPDRFGPSLARSVEQCGEFGIEYGEYTGLGIEAKCR